MPHPRRPRAWSLSCCKRSSLPDRPAVGQPRAATHRPPLTRTTRVTGTSGLHPGPCRDPPHHHPHSDPTLPLVKRHRVSGQRMPMVVQPSQFLRSLHCLRPPFCPDTPFICPSSSPRCPPADPSRGPLDLPRVLTPVLPNWPAGLSGHTVFLPGGPGPALLWGCRHLAQLHGPCWPVVLWCRLPARPP